MRWMYFMLILVPITIIMHFMHAPAIWMFPLACLAILPLAGVMGHSTEELAKYRGEAVGGFLNATFGNAAELIIAIVAVMNGELEIVRASIIGSVIGNILLVLGLSLLLGGLRFRNQTYNREIAETNTTMMTLAVIALLVPAFFVKSVPGLKMEDMRVEQMTLYIAVLLIALYIGNVVFSLWTHKDLFQGGEHSEHEKPHMKQSVAIMLLVASTIGIAIESEFLIHSMDPFIEKFHLSKLFVGVILIPIVGNAAEHSTAVVMAIKNKMNISINIAVSSGTQIAMFVAPVIILLSFATKKHMSIIFTDVELVSIALSVLIAGQVTRDGRSNWLEGALLLVVYAIIGIAYFLIPTGQVLGLPPGGGGGGH